jgi:ABC-type branched-subunit amino acid transport system substrate-binding protein
MNRLFPAILVALLSTTVFAQDDVERIKPMVKGGRCSEAIAPLKKIYASSFRKTEGEKAAVMLTECYLREHKRTEAYDVASRFLEYHVKSDYRERMELARAVIDVENGSVFDGVESMLKVLSYSTNPAARTRAKDVVIQTLAASLLNAEQLQSLLEKYPVDRDVIGWLELQIGRECQNVKRYKAARYWYKKVLKSSSSESLQNTAKKGLSALEGLGAGLPTVLVLAPLSGDFAEFGAAAVQGVVLAYEQAGLKDKVNIRIQDTHADAAIALMRTQRAVNQDSVIAIVGPIMSAPATAVAAWLGANYQHVPMLTPTATDGGIAKLGPNIFQVNITMDILSQTIADFAIKCLDIREFGVMSPLGDFGSSMSENFTRAVERRGGSVVAFRNYEEGRPDYKTEFNLLRDVRFNQENRRRNIARGADDLDAVNPRDRKVYLADSTVEIPGLFIPATNPADAGAMVSQAAFNKVSGTYLGTSGWYGRELLIQGKRLVEGSFFSVPDLDMNKGTAYTNFVKDFKDRWGVEPGEDKVSGLSFDAANIIFTALDAISGKQDDMTHYINATKDFKGIYGDIKFRRGANANTKIVTVKKGKFEVVTACEKQDARKEKEAPKSKKKK